MTAITDVVAQAPADRARALVVLSAVDSKEWKQDMELKEKAPLQQLWPGSLRFLSSSRGKRRYSYLLAIG